MGLRLEPELEDFAVEGAAADFEDASGFFLVPAARIEDADDMGPFGFAKRWEPLSGVFSRRLCRVEKLDVGRAYRPTRRRQRGSRDGAFELAGRAADVLRNWRPDTAQEFAVVIEHLMMAIDRIQAAVDAIVPWNELDGAVRLRGSLS